MPLALTDPRWDSIPNCYGSESSRLVGWLKQAYNEPEAILDLLGNIVNEVNHQGDFSPAIYPVVPHLCSLSQFCDEQAKVQILISAGGLYMVGDMHGWTQCDDDVEDEMRGLALVCANTLAPLIPRIEDPLDFQWAISAVSAFMGYSSFAKEISGFDYPVEE